MCFSFSRIITDHEVHMKEMLKGGLEWFCSEKKGKGNFAAKLEGRYNPFSRVSEFLSRAIHCACVDAGQHPPIALSARERSKLAS